MRARKLFINLDVFKVSLFYIFGNFLIENGIIESIIVLFYFF